MCMCRFGYVHMTARAYGSQKRATYPLELELLAAVNWLMWLLGTH